MSDQAVIELPGDDMIPVAVFRAATGNFSTDRRGRLVLQLIVPLDDKYDALPITDQPGMMMHVVAFRRPRSSERRDDAGPDGAGDVGEDG